jgi:hypothetical protein
VLDGLFEPRTSSHVRRLKSRVVTLSGLAIVTLAVLAGCASSPTKPPESGTLFKAAPDAVQKAAVVALVANGFDVTKQDARYVEGSRPRKWGLFVGSGGETAGIWIEPVDADTSRVRVDTARTFAGLAGQQNWDSEIIIELTKALNVKP